MNVSVLCIPDPSSQNWNGDLDKAVEMVMLGFFIHAHGMGKPTDVPVKHSVVAARGDVNFPSFLP